MRSSIFWKEIRKLFDQLLASGWEVGGQIGKLSLGLSQDSQ